MVYKNGIKVYVITGCCAGLFYGFFMGLFLNNMKSGAMSGLLFGVFFTLCTALSGKHFEKKFRRHRAEISKVRKIICEGPANHKKGANAIGGWLFFSEDTMEFYPHKMNIGGQNISILTDEIVSVETRAQQLKIHTKTGENFTFIVNKAKLWKQSITEILYST